MKKAVVIFNPVAGSGRSEQLSHEVEAQLTSEGWHVERLPTRAADGASGIAREAASRSDRIVVIGGDGSLRETIAGLGDAAGRVEIGLVPAGNANVVARELGVPLEATEAIRALSRSSPVAMDVALCNGELFLAMVGVGWDARTVRFLDAIRRTRVGRIWYRIWADSAYVLAGLAAALKLRSPRFRIRMDDALVPSRFRGAHFCNLRTYGKGWSMAPEASGRSGLLHCQARRRSLLPFLVWHLVCALFRRRTPRFISEYAHGRRFRVESDRPVDVQVDGDYRGVQRSLEIEVKPGAARLLVPDR